MYWASAPFAYRSPIWALFQLKMRLKRTVTDVFGKLSLGDIDRGSPNLSIFAYESLTNS